MKKLFNLIKKHFSLRQDNEISIECNPSTLDEEKIETIAEFANRVSLGIQSFNCEFRRTIGRYGSITNINQIIKWLLKYGIDNIGCDLIYAIPGQIITDWELELKKASDLPIKHISTYSLTYEEGTQLFNNATDKIEDFTNHVHAENEAEMWELTNSFLNNKQFARYEISNFSKPYLGCGPAAASFDGGNRWTNPSSLELWRNNEKSEIDKITKEERAREIFVMGLRTSQGWNFNEFKTISGFDFTEWSSEISPLISNKLLIYKNSNICCSEQGFLLWNEIAERLI